jgi:hypothetical protein
MAFNPLGLCVISKQKKRLSILQARLKSFRSQEKGKEIKGGQFNTFLEVELFFSLTSYLSWHISVNQAPGLTNCHPPRFRKPKKKLKTHKRDKTLKGSNKPQSQRPNPEILFIQGRREHLSSRDLQVNFFV